MSQLHGASQLRLIDLRATRPLLALWGGLAVLDLGRSAGAAPQLQVTAVLALVACCSWGAGKVVATCVAAIGWLLLNGFVVHQWGNLGFAGVGDVVRGALLLVVSLAVAEPRR